MGKIKKTFQLMLCLILFALPTRTQASECLFLGDTIRLRRIEYDFVKYSYNSPDKKGENRRRSTSRTYYFFEGDTLDKDLTAKNLLRDMPLSKYKKAIKKERRRENSYEFLQLTFFILIPLGCLIGIVLLAFGFNFWRLLAMLGLLAVWLLAWFFGILNAFGKQHLRKDTLMRIIDQYNEEISKKP